MIRRCCEKDGMEINTWLLWLIHRLRVTTLHLPQVRCPMMFRCVEFRHAFPASKHTFQCAKRITLTRANQCRLNLWFGTSAWQCRSSIVILSNIAVNTLWMSNRPIQSQIAQFKCSFGKHLLASPTACISFLFFRNELFGQQVIFSTWRHI